MTTSTYTPPAFGTPEMALLLETPTPEFEAWKRSPAWLPWMRAQLRRCGRDLFVYSAYWQSYDASLPRAEREAKAERAMARAQDVLDAAHRRRGPGQHHDGIQHHDPLEGAGV